MISILDSLLHCRDGLRLRRLRETDLPAFSAYRSDPEVARYQGWSPMSESKALEFLREHAALTSHLPGTWLQLAIADAATDRLLGDMGIWLLHDRSCAEIGITVAPAEQGQGVGRRAMRTICALLLADPAIIHIRADADARNLACRRMLAAVGFRETGTAEVFVKEEACIEYRHILDRGQTAPTLQGEGA